MTLTPNMRTILVAILEEMRRLEAVPDRPRAGADRDQWYALWCERKDYERFGVPHALARWLGHAPTPSESAVFSRALRNMEAMGLLVRINCCGGGRATHVQLTEIGRAEAERLVADQDAVLAAIAKDMEALLNATGSVPQEDAAGESNSVDSAGEQR